jgi:hypothetical protein
VFGCNETFARAGSADMYFVSRAKSFRVVQAGTTAALNFRFTRHKASKYRHFYIYAILLSKLLFILTN